MFVGLTRVCFEGRWVHPAALSSLARALVSLGLRGLIEFTRACRGGRLVNSRAPWRSPRAIEFTCMRVWGHWDHPG